MVRESGRRESKDELTPERLGWWGKGSWREGGARVEEEEEEDELGRKESQRGGSQGGGGERRMGAGSKKGLRT